MHCYGRLRDSNLIVIFNVFVDRLLFIVVEVNERDCLQRGCVEATAAAERRKGRCTACNKVKLAPDWRSVIHLVAIL